MALAWHPEFGNLLAIGCYDGSVAVYDVAQKSGRPLYTASAKARRHSDTVWQVVWQVRLCVCGGRVGGGGVRKGWT
jgi:dynein intermediate chain 1